MKKLKKLKKPDLSKTIPPRLRRRVPSTEEKFQDALASVPRITNDTVADHREEVLSSARKYIYPLQHSKRYVVRISLALFAVVVLSFFIFCGLSLYKFQTTSGFMYDVTRIVPFPIAKAGDSWVSYESYLFELHHNMHYYQTQQQASFSTKDGRAQLDRLRQQAMTQVIQDAYVKQLAARHHVSISNQRVDSQLALLRNENRLGNNERVFREVLKEFWGWNVTDFKRELRQQLLQQAVANKLDTDTHARANTALSQLKGGADFAKLAAAVSDDQATKANGGRYTQAVTLHDRDIPPAVTSEIFRLQANQLSGIIDSGYSLDIVKVLDNGQASRNALHLQFNFKDISTYTKPLEKKNPPKRYIKV